MGNTVNNSGAKASAPTSIALGDELRGERATLGKTLLDIQRDLRIKAAYIAAIEDAKPDGLPQPELHRRLRALLRPLPRAGPGRGLPPLLPRERLRRQGRRRRCADRPGGAGRTAAQPAGGFRPDFADRAARPGRRAAGERPLRGDRLGAGAGGARASGSATAAGRCCRTSSGCSSRRSRTCRWRWPRSTPPPAPETPAFEEPALTELATPGGGDRAGRALPPAGARGADPRAARRPDRRHSIPTRAGCSPARARRFAAGPGAAAAPADARRRSRRC